MNVLLGGTSLSGPLTGIGQYTYSLCEELRRLEQDVTLFYGHRWGRELPAAGGGKSRGSSGANLRQLVRSVPFSYKAAALMRGTAFRAWRLLNDADVYHEPNFIPHRFNGPTVITVHDLSVIRFPEMHPKTRIRAIGNQLKHAIDRSQRVITVSDFVRNEVLEYFDCPPEKVVAVHNGVAPDFRARSEDECRVRLEEVGLGYQGYVLSVGTFEPRKNLGRLAEAWLKLPVDMRRAYPLVLAGARGWGESEFANSLQKLEQEGSLLKLDYVDPEMLRVLYAGARLFIYPSLYEGFGLPVLEAMASGVPVICSDVSSLPEVAGGVACLVDPHSAEEIARAAEALLQDEARCASMVAKGLERASGMSWGSTAAKTLDVYRQALS